MEKIIQELKVEMAKMVITIDFLEKMLMLSPNREMQEHRLEVIKAFSYLENEISRVEGLKK